MSEFSELYSTLDAVRSELKQIVGGRVTFQEGLEQVHNQLRPVLDNLIIFLHGVLRNGETQQFDPRTSFQCENDAQIDQLLRNLAKRDELMCKLLADPSVSNALVRDKKLCKLSSNEFPNFLIDEGLGELVSLHQQGSRSSGLMSSGLDRKEHEKVVRLWLELHTVAAGIGRAICLAKRLQNLAVNGGLLFLAQESSKHLLADALNFIEARLDDLQRRDKECRDLVRHAHSLSINQPGARIWCCLSDKWSSTQDALNLTVSGLDNVKRVAEHLRMMRTQLKTLDVKGVEEDIRAQVEDFNQYLQHVLTAHPHSCDFSGVEVA